MNKVKPIQKAVVGGASGGGVLMVVFLALINIASRNYGLEIEQTEAVAIAGASSLLWGFVQGWIVWRVPNIQKAVDKIGE